MSATSDGDLCPVELMRRSELLGALQSAPRRPAELEAVTSLSRSTVHRAIQSLEDAGIVRVNDGVVELTGSGRAVTSHVVDASEAITTAQRLRPLLDAIDSAAVSLPLAHLDDAETTFADSRHAHLSVRRIRELVADARQVRLFSGVVSPLYLDIAFEQVRRGTEVEMILDREVVEVLFAEYATEARDAARTGQFHVRAFDACPFDLFICDDTVAIAAHVDGFLHGLVESADPVVQEWATATFEAYTARAEYVTVI